MAKKAKPDRALKPSQREAITEFSARFGTEPSYEERTRKKRLITAILIAVGVLLLIAVGFFVTDVLLRITEQPIDDEAEALLLPVHSFLQRI
ncbi:MAG: hypothetical protein IKD72_01615 [Clostridia bacterium]|nr:hypothetical protein [Clostridia bacterium]